VATTAAETVPSDETTRSPAPAVSLPLVLALGYALVVAGLITLRATVDRLDFLGLGWIVLLALVPVLPWLIPAVAPAVRRAAPFIENVKVPGFVEISLRGATRQVSGLGALEDVLTSDHLAHNLAATPTPFTTTDAITVIEGVRRVRATRAQAVIVDLAEGAKWRLPNLYFLAWLLVNDPLTGWIVFTEARGGTPGYFVGTCSAADLRARIEATYPAYATAWQQLEYYDPTLDQNMQPLADQFNTIRAAIAPVGQGEVPTLKWVTTEEVRSILGPHLGTFSIDWAEQLDRAGLETIVRSPAPYVAATTGDGRFRGFVEQRAVVLEFTRRVLRAD
jgi:hypothetical protein